MSRRPPLPPPAMHFDRIPKPKRPMPALVAQDSKVIKPGKLVQSKSSAFRKKRELDTSKLKTYGELPTAYGRSGIKRVKKDLFPEETSITAVEKKKRSVAAKRTRSRHTAMDRNARTAGELRRGMIRAVGGLTAPYRVTDLRNQILADFRDVKTHEKARGVTKAQQDEFDRKLVQQMREINRHDQDDIFLVGKRPVPYFPNKQYILPNWWEHARDRAGIKRGRTGI